MNTLTTLTKIFSTFGCKGSTMHVFTGLVLLRAANGYVCPYCGNEVEDISKTPVGMAYFAHVRPDLFNRRTHGKKA